MKVAVVGLEGHQIKVSGEGHHRVLFDGLVDDALTLIALIVFPDVREWLSLERIVQGHGLLLGVGWHSDLCGPSFLAWSLTRQRGGMYAHRQQEAGASEKSDPIRVHQHFPPTFLGT